MGYEEEDPPMGAVGFMESAVGVALVLAAIFALTCLVLSLERASDVPPRAHAVSKPPRSAP